MTPTLPADFPQAGRVALHAVKKIHTPTYIKILEFIGVNWGDLDAIDKAIDIWENEAKKAAQSIDRLNADLARLTGGPAVEHWAGNAREEYVNWRTDFKLKTLDKYLQGMWNVKSQLDAIHGNVWSIRGHVVALVIEAGVIAGAAATAENPVSAAAAVIALIAFTGTFLDYRFRVQNDLDEKGRMLETIRERDTIDRGGGAVSLPFDTQVIGDWENWENKHS